jgi:hypothetical protein
MTSVSSPVSPSVPAVPPDAWWRRPGAAAVGGAVVWAVLFAAISFYWGAGGTWAASTIGPALSDPVRDRDPAMVALVHGTGVAKLVAAALAASLLVHRPAPSRRRLRAVSWVVAGGVAAYGLANLIQHALFVAGALDVPDGLGESAARWHLAVWDPWWILGGVLLLVATARTRAVEPAEP